MYVNIYVSTSNVKSFRGCDILQGENELPGLVHLSMSRILAMCQGTTSLVEMSYYEIYMDRCFDLLEPKEEEITVLEDKYGQIHLKGLARVSINTMSEFHEAFSCAIQRRKVAHTGINDVSSRSHGVLVIAVSTPADDTSENVVMGKLNLIDLAGSYTILELNKFCYIISRVTNGVLVLICSDQVTKITGRLAIMVFGSRRVPRSTSPSSPCHKLYMR